MAVRVAEAFNGDEVRVGVFPASAATAPSLTLVDTCSAASKPTLAWSGQAFDVFYECTSAGGQSVRHVRLDATGAPLGPATTVAAQANSPLAVFPLLYWWTGSGWVQGPIDAGSGAVSTNAPASFSSRAVAQGVVKARESSWALETTCTGGEDVVPSGGFHACPWDAAGQPAGACVTFYSGSGCPSASIAGNGDGAFVAFEVGENSWLVPLGGVTASGAVHPVGIGRPQSVRPRRFRCDEAWNCAVLVDEPTVDVIVGASRTSWTGSFGDDPWPSGELSSLAWYAVDGSASPTVTIARWAEHFEDQPVLADALSPSGIGVFATGSPATFSFIGPDGTVAWQTALPPSAAPTWAFAEASHFRLFSFESAAVGSGVALSSEYVVDPTGVLSTKDLTMPPSVLDLTQALMTDCAGTYFATGPTVGRILRYDPARDSDFVEWKAPPAPLGPFGCGGQVIGALDEYTGTAFGSVDADVGTRLSLWSADGTALPSATLYGWNPVALSLASDSEGFAWLAWSGADADAGAGSFDMVRVTPRSVARGRLATPFPPQTISHLQSAASSPGSLAAVYCDDATGACWLSNWRQ